MGARRTERAGTAPGHGRLLRPGAHRQGTLRHCQPAGRAAERRRRMELDAQRRKQRLDYAADTEEAIGGRQHAILGQRAGAQIHRPRGAALLRPMDQAQPQERLRLPAHQHRLPIHPLLLWQRIDRGLQVLLRQRLEALPRLRAPLHPGAAGAGLPARRRHQAGARPHPPPQGKSTHQRRDGHLLARQPLRMVVVPAPHRDPSPSYPGLQRGDPQGHRLHRTDAAVAPQTEADHPLGQRRSHRESHRRAHGGQRL